MKKELIAITREIVYNERGEKVGWELHNYDVNENTDMNNKNILFVGTWSEMIQWNKDHNRKCFSRFVDDEEFILSSWD